MENVWLKVEKWWNKIKKPLQYTIGDIIVPSSSWVPLPSEAGPPGAGGHNKVSNSALAGLLILILVIDTKQIQ